MDLLDDAQDKLEDALNAEGRPPSHVAVGVLLCFGAVAASAYLAHRAEPGEFQESVERHTDTRRNSLSGVWPAVFSLTTLAALRIWNAPHGPERTRALGLWGVSQVLNAVWVSLSPERRGLQALGAAATAAATAAYAIAARRVDVKAGGMVAPMVGMAVTNLLTGELWRRSKPPGPGRR